MRKLRCCICLALSAVFLVLLLPSGRHAAQAAVPEGWTGIFVRSDLEKVTLKPDENYILMNDIDLSDSSWNALCSEDLPFTGVFDGNGKNLYGMTASSATSACGLFSYVCGGTIRNLSVSGKAQGPVAGILAGKISEGSVTGCSVSGTVTTTFCGGGLAGQISTQAVTVTDCVSRCAVGGNGSSDSEFLLGGIIGGVYGEGVEISSCAFYGTLSFSGALASVGGMAGAVDGEAVLRNCGSEGSLTLNVTDTATVGGIVGRMGQKNVSVENCSFRGDWSVPACNGSLTMGGIAGLLYVSDRSSVTGCSSYGSLTTAAVSSSVGGIVGSSLAAGGTAAVSRCTSYVSLTGTGCPLALGGICGTNGAEAGISLVEDCYSGGTVSHTQPINGNTSLSFGGIVGRNGGEGTSIIRRCFSSCEVNVSYPMSNGAVVGLIWGADSTVSQCYYRSGVTEYFAQPIEGAALTDPEAFTGFDFSSVWKIDASVGMPLLRESTADSISYLIGDVDGNGRRTEYDARLLAQYLTGEVILTDAQRSRADMNGDGILSARDAALILRECD